VTSTSGVPLSQFGPQVFKIIDDSMFIPVEFTSAQRLVEKEKFEELLIITTQTSKLNQINNTVCDLLISSIENGRKDRESLFKS